MQNINEFKKSINYEEKIEIVRKEIKEFFKNNKLKDMEEKFFLDNICLIFARNLPEIYDNPYFDLQ